MDGHKAEKLGTQPIPSLLGGMSAQTTMSLLLYSVYALTDTFFLSRGVGAYAAGGVTLTAPLMMVLGAVATTMGSGGASIISRALGRGDKEKAASTAANAFLLFWLTAAAFSVAGSIFARPLMRLMGADDILMPYALGYARIIFAGAVTSTGFSAIIRAEGNTRFSMYIWVFPVLTNFALDPLFIFAFGWGAEGAAAATVIAQTVSAGMSVYYFFFSKRDAYKIRREHFKLKRACLAEIISIGSPSLISQVSMSFVATLVNQILLRAGGADALTAFGIVSRIQSFFALPQNGIVQGMQPIVGYNLASGQYGRVKQTIRLSMLAGFVYGLIVLLIVLPGAAPVMGIFVTEENIALLGASILPLITLGFPFKGVPAVVAAVYQAEGKPFMSVLVSLTGAVAVRLPLLFLLANVAGLRGIWLSFAIADALTAVITYIIYKRGSKNYDK